VFDMLTQKKSKYAVVAIENSLYGTINEVYDLLLKTGHQICGEYYLRISQCLVGFPNITLEDITEVHSHPVALAQCDNFLDSKLPAATRYEHHDTAGSVKDIKKWGDKSKAAIASEEAAKTYGMEIIAKSIETNKENFTRFVLLTSRDSSHRADQANKTSIVLQTPKDTKAGSLYHSLGAFAKRGINLTALHSRPVIGKAWHYMFYIDIEENVGSKKYQEAFQELSDMGCKVDILGTYKSHSSK
jgi:prephenate dehydratase